MTHTQTRLSNWQSRCCCFSAWNRAYAPIQSYSIRHAYCMGYNYGRMSACCWWRRATAIVVGCPQSIYIHIHVTCDNRCTIDSPGGDRWIIWYRKIVHSIRSRRENRMHRSVRYAQKVYVARALSVHVRTFFIIFFFLKTYSTLWCMEYYYYLCDLYVCWSDIIKRIHSLTCTLLSFAVSLDAARARASTVRVFVVVIVMLMFWSFAANGMCLKRQQHPTTNRQQE